MRESHLADFTCDFEASSRNLIIVFCFRMVEWLGQSSQDVPLMESTGLCKWRSNDRAERSTVIRFEPATFTSRIPLPQCLRVSVSANHKVFSLRLAHFVQSVASA